VAETSRSGNFAFCHASLSPNESCCTTAQPRCAVVSLCNPGASAEIEALEVMIKHELPKYAPFGCGAQLRGLLGRDGTQSRCRCGTR
jgi:hypothetical protein